MANLSIPKSPSAPVSSRIAVLGVASRQAGIPVHVLCRRLLFLGLGIVMAWELPEWPGRQGLRT